MQLLGGKGLLEMTQQQEIVQVEVDAEQQHKHADDDFKIGVVVGTHTQRLVAEAAGARRAEGMNQRVKQRHTARTEQHGFQYRHSEVNSVQNLRTVTQFAGNLAAGRAGDLGAHQVHGAAVRHRQHRHRKNKNAHAAYPVGKAAPEQDAVAQRLNIGQNCGAGGCKAGHCLKKGVYKGRNLAGNHKRQRAENRHQHPDQRHDGQTIAGVDARIFGCAQTGHKAQRQQYQGGPQEAEHNAPLAVNCRADHR